MANIEITAHNDVTSDDKFSTVPYYAPSLTYLPNDNSTYYVQSIDGFVVNGSEIEKLCVRVSLLRLPAIIPPGAWEIFEVIRVLVPIFDLRFFWGGFYVF